MLFGNINKKLEGDFMVLGIDPSLNGTGIVLLNSGGQIIYQKAIILNKTKKTTIKGFSRINLILSIIKEVIKENQNLIKLVIIEGYSFGSNRSRSVFDLGELGGIIKYFLYEKEISFVEVPPKFLKKYVTGNGNADKLMMIDSVKKRYKENFDNDNICDAYALARLGIELSPIDLERLNPAGRTT